MKGVSIANKHLSTPEDGKHLEESMNESHGSSSPHPMATSNAPCHVEKLEGSNVNYKLMWKQMLRETAWQLINMLSINLSILLPRV